MCSHSHDPHILCPHCDLLVTLPPLKYGQKANCPRCKSTLTMCWKEPRKRPVGYALSALFMLLLANMFSFVNMFSASATCNSISSCVYVADLLLPVALQGSVNIYFVRLWPSVLQVARNT